MASRWQEKVVEKLPAGISMWLLVLLLGALFLASPIIDYVAARDSRQFNAEVLSGVNDLKTSERTQSEVLDDLMFNVQVLRNGNEDNLSYNGALYVAYKVLESSEKEVLEEVYRIIDKNHIQDTIRQRIIRSAFTIRILNYYESDHAAMSRMYYHSNQLSMAWDQIDPNEFIDGVCDRMFNSDFVNDPTHTQLKLDLGLYIHDKFDDYRSLVTQVINEM